MKKSIVVLMVLVLLAGLVHFFVTSQEEKKADQAIENLAQSDVYKDLELKYYKGKIIKMDENIQEDVVSKVQQVTVKISSGNLAGQTLVASRDIFDDYVRDVDVKLNQKVVVVGLENMEGQVEYFIQNEASDSYILLLILIFVVALLVVGRMQGLKTIITLTITLFFIFMVELPLLIKGYHAVWVTIMVAFFITVNTVTIITGLTKKSIAAILGTLFGVLIAGGISVFVTSQVKVIGIARSEAHGLLTEIEAAINLQHLLFAIIIIGALGAVMDVAMSIASSIDAVHKVDPSLSRKALFKSGMGVGRDIMGTMANTLILAYTASMLPIIMLFMAEQKNFIYVSNIDEIASDVIRSLAGSIGLVLTIPVTGLIMVMFIKQQETPKALKDVKTEE